MADVSMLSVMMARHQKIWLLSLPDGMLAVVLRGEHVCARVDVVGPFIELTYVILESTAYRTSAFIVLRKPFGKFPVIGPAGTGDDAEKLNGRRGRIP